MTKTKKRFYALIYISTHTLTWSVTVAKMKEYGKVVNFNSHAHVERDCIDEVADQCVEISTHTLTWSVTKRL